MWVYFTPNPKKTGISYKYKYTANIDVKNPLTISPQNKSSQIYPELKQYLERPKESKNWSSEKLSEYARKMDDKYDEEFRKLLLRDWYDGVIMLDGKWNVSQYVVLDPQKVNIKNKQAI